MLTGSRALRTVPVQTLVSLGHQRHGDHRPIYAESEQVAAEVHVLLEIDLPPPTKADQRLALDAEQFARLPNGQP